MFPSLLLLHIKRTELCKWRFPHTNSLCDVNMSGQVWIEMAGIITALVLCSIMAAEQDLRASGEPNLLSVWGHNGPIKDPCFTGEKTLLHSINHYQLRRSRKVSPFFHPASCQTLEGIVIDADLWPAHDMLMQQRNVETSKCAWGEVEHLWETELSHLRMF